MYECVSYALLQVRSRPICPGAMVFREQVRVIPETTDRYGLTVGRVVVEDTDVNAEMVRAGHAWVYREYVNREMLFELEAEAREARRGIWKLPESDRVAPWTWRKLRREGKTVQQAASESAEEKSETEVFECGAKRYCGDIASCKEGGSFWRNVGWTVLIGIVMACPVNLFANGE